MIYYPKYFIVEELVPPHIFANLSKDRILGSFNQELLITIDNIREYFDAPVTVNTWHYGGNLKCRGFRGGLNCKNVGASYSMHRFWKAIDFNIDGYTAEEVRKAILDNQYQFPDIKRMEKDVNWVHIDFLETNSDKIVLFNG